MNRLIETRKKIAEEYAEKARNKAEQDRQAGLTGAGKDPMLVVNKDMAVLKKHLHDWEEAKKAAEKQETFLKNLIERVETARVFVANATESLRQALHHKEEWKNHEELSYIYDMKGLF